MATDLYSLLPASKPSVISLYCGDNVSFAAKFFGKGCISNEIVDFDVLHDRRRDLGRGREIRAGLDMDEVGVYARKGGVRS